MNEPIVDVVVCVNNALEDTRRCLQSVIAATDCSYRLTIVNDGSDAPTTDYLREASGAHAHVGVIKNATPRRYTRAANQGICAGTAPYVVLLNSDAVVGSNWIGNLLAAMALDARTGLVGPLSNAAAFQSIPDVYDQNGAYAINPLPAGTTSQAVSSIVERHSLRLFPTTTLLNGFCMMLRRELFECIGLLDDEAFPLGYGEETDFCIRAARAGYVLRVADQTYVFHGKSKSYGAVMRDELARRGRLTLHLKHGLSAVETAYDGARRHPQMLRIREHFRGLLSSETP